MSINHQKWLVTKKLENKSVNEGKYGTDDDDVDDDNDKKKPNDVMKIDWFVKSQRLLYILYACGKST